MQIVFPDARQVNKSPTTTVCKKCAYVQKNRNQIYESFDLPPDNEHTFSASYSHGEPILDVETIDERITSMNLHRTQKK